MIKISKIDDVALQQKVNCNPLLRYRCLGSFPSNYVSTLALEIFVRIINQARKKCWVTLATYFSLLFHSIVPLIHSSCYNLYVFFCFLSNCFSLNVTIITRNRCLCRRSCKKKSVEIFSRKSVTVPKIYLTPYLYT